MFTALNNPQIFEFYLFLDRNIDNIIYNCFYHDGEKEGEIDQMWLGYYSSLIVTHIEVIFKNKIDFKNFYNEYLNLNFDSIDNKEISWKLFFDKYKEEYGGLDILLLILKKVQRIRQEQDENLNKQLALVS